MPSHGVRLGAGARLEVVRAAPPEAPAALRATVERLRAAAGTGAVEIVDVTDDGDALEVVLAYAGRPVTAPLRADALARVGASLAGTLADLHARQIVHGAVVPEHVLVDADGTVRLCGFGANGSAPSDDVLALGELLRTLLDRDDTSDAAWTLRGIADRCCTDDASSRPTAAAVGAALASAGHPRRAVARPRVAASPRRRPSVPTLALTAVVVVVIAVAIGVTALSTRPSGARSQAAHTTTSATGRATSSTTTAPTAARRVWPPPPPHVIEADGRWTFGSEDDRVLLLDADCDGIATPVLVRHSDGAVFAVDEWVDGARGRLVTVVPNVVDAAVEHREQCDTLVLTTSDGRTVRPKLTAA
jgi:hypothetical protein